MKSIKKILVVLVCFILLLQLSCKDSVVNPGTGKWELLGLEGILVNDLKLFDNYLYACAGKDGLFRLNLTSTKGEWEYLGLADSSVERQLNHIFFQI